ncbi:TPA: DUF1642 domain-containing protein [Streptococcus suis]
MDRLEMLVYWQEAIKTIEQDKIQLGRIVETNGGVNTIQRKIELVDYVPLEIVVSMIDKINEPEKVVVPEFIDSFIRYAKAEGMSLFIAIDNAQNKESEWIIAHEDTFARAWLDGHEVEKEQLYVVNLGKIVGLSIYLRKIGKSLHSERGDWSTTGDIRFAERLTETEIKQKDEQLWQFAVPVEDN